MEVDKSKERNITVLKTDPSSTTKVESFYGAIAVSSFIVTWLASAASPLILFLAWRGGYNYIVAFIIFITVIAYLPWEHGTISYFFQNFLTKYHPLYYNGVSMVFEGDSPTTSKNHKQNFYAVHPHGAFCIGWALLYHNPVMRGIRFCFAPSLYASPFFRIFSRMANNPGSASRPSIDAYLRNGEDVALPPGGFEEATLTSTVKDRVFIKRRYGFVRLCLKHGVAIRPVYVFGEGQLFNNIQGLFPTRLAMNRFGVPAILVWGKWFFPFLPKNNVKLHVVIGRPLNVPKIDSPSREIVTMWHNKYIDELKRIYDEHKEDAYGPEKGKEAKLEVW